MSHTSLGLVLIFASLSACASAQRPRSATGAATAAVQPAAVKEADAETSERRFGIGEARQRREEQRAKKRAEEAARKKVDVRAGQSGAAPGQPTSPLKTTP